MSVVGSDYDDLKQYNLAEIYDPTRKFKVKTSNGAAAEEEDKYDGPPFHVAVNEAGPKDNVIPTEKSDDEKTSLDFQKAADDAHLTAL